MFRSIALSATALSMTGLVALAAGAPVPNINPEPSCRSAAARVAPIADLEVCMRKERAARDRLVRFWGEFSAGDKATCIPLATAGGNPTYTELLTCLEVERDARRLRESESRGSTTDASSR